MPSKNSDIITACITGTVAKAADRYAMDVMGLKSLTLMETASSKIADYVMRHYPLHGGDFRYPEESMAVSGVDANDSERPEKAESKGRGPKISALCGVGNNGADGICASRMLLEEGYQPRVYIVGSLEKASWEFLYQLVYFQQAGGTVKMYRPNIDPTDADAAAMVVDPEIDPVDAGEAAVMAAHPDSGTVADDASPFLTNRLPDDDILIDGIFGIGLHREIAGDYRTFIEEANRRRHGFVLAIDAPSGINTDTGELMGCGIKADVTITFGRNKTGLVCGAGQNFAGRVLVEDIGIPDEAYIEAETHA